MSQKSQQSRHRLHSLRSSEYDCMNVELLLRSSPSSLSFQSSQCVVTMHMMCGGYRAFHLSRLQMMQVMCDCICNNHALCVVELVSDSLTDSTQCSWLWNAVRINVLMLFVPFLCLHVFGHYFRSKVRYTVLYMYVMYCCVCMCFCLMYVLIYVVLFFVFYCEIYCICASNG